MPDTSSRSVFIVDDDPAARTSIAALVGAHAVPSETFDSAEQFLANYDPRRRGCLVVDARMTGMSGIDLMVRLRERHSNLPVIAIAGFADVPTAVRAMHAGAYTFLEKSCGEQKLWDAIEAALHAEQRADRDRAEQSDMAARRATLNPAEREVLERLLAGKANKSIASELNLGLRTVELRRATIMKKMKANSLAELIRFILIADGHRKAS